MSDKIDPREVKIDTSKKPHGWRELVIILAAVVVILFGCLVVFIFQKMAERDAERELQKFLDGPPTLKKE